MLQSGGLYDEKEVIELEVDAERSGLPLHEVPVAEEGREDVAVESDVRS